MKALIFSLILTSLGLYPETGKVIEVNHKTDIVSVEIPNGYVYGFYGAEDWKVGDYASLLMSNNRTEVVTDDIVVDAEFSRIEALD